VLITVDEVESVAEALGEGPGWRLLDAASRLKRDWMRDLMEAYRTQFEDLKAWKEDYQPWAERELHTRDAWLEMHGWRIRALQEECFGPAQAAPPPPADFPPELRDGYTMGGRVPVAYGYDNAFYPPNHPMIYTDGEVDACLEKIKRGETFYYGDTDHALRAAFAAFPLTGLEVAVLGSRTPWYEAMCLAHGGHPLTIDYNPILVRCSRLRAFTAAQWRRHPQPVGAALSISSVEHSGLGRYGDPLEPDADLRTMAEIRAMLPPGGLLYLSVPVGLDQVLFNLHRIYGPLRLPLLLEGWELLARFGWDGAFKLPVGPEPVFVLRRPAQEGADR
jgi:hypothetical protein